MTEKTQVINWSINDARIAEIKEAIGEVDAYKDLDAAKAAKQKLTKCRSKLTEVHKETKAEALKFGRKCDTEKNRLLKLIAEIEDPITEQLDEIKNAEARKEEARLEKIEIQMQIITGFAHDRHDLDTESLRTRLAGLEAAEVTEEIFQEQLDTAEAYKEEGLLKLRNSLRKSEERDAEEARLEERRKEQEAEEARLAAEREEFEAEKQKLADEQREREEQEAADREKKQAAEDKRLAAEREELEAKQREIEEREANERRIREEEVAEAARLAAAPDVEKLDRLAAEIRQFPLPICDTDEGVSVVSMVEQRLQSLANTVEMQTEAMK